MDADEMRKHRLAERIERIKDAHRRIAQDDPDGTLAAMLTDPCEAEQQAYDAAVTVAAEILLDVEDAQSELTSLQGDYNIAFNLAMAAYTVLDACRNPPP